MRRPWYTLVAACLCGLVFGSALGLSALMIGFLPQFLEGLVVIFLLPVGLPVLAGVMLGRVERGWLTERGDGPLKMTLLIGGATLWLPAALYLVALQPDVDVLRRGVAQVDDLDAASAGWVMAQPDPAGWGQRGERTETFTDKQNQTCTSWMIAAPLRATTPERAEWAWMCVVDHCTGSVESSRAAARAAMAQATGGQVIREAATRSHCQRAIQEATGSATSGELLLLTPANDVAQVMERGRSRVAWFVWIVFALWVLIASVRAGEEMAQRYGRDEA